METIEINGSFKSLNKYSSEIIKKGNLYDLEDNCLTFFSGLKLVFWYFQENIEEMKAFLRENQIEYRNLTSAEDVELEFEPFYYSVYKNRLENSNDIILFWNEIMYLYEDVYCFYKFPEKDYYRVRTYLVKNKIIFKDLS